MKDIFATDQKAGPNNIPQRYVEYTSINVGITKFNDNAAITGLLGYREGNKDTLKLTNISAAELREPRTLLDLLYSSNVMLQKQDCTGPCQENEF
jgi:hypothetical protein